MMKKCLSLLLVLAMLLSVCPMGVFADEGTPSAGDTASNTLELVAIYDRGGARLIASGIGSAEIGEDVVPEGKGIMKTFLLDAETLIPYEVSQEDYDFEETETDEADGLDAAEPTEETEATEATEETLAPEETEEPTEATESTEAAEETTEAPTEAPEEELTLEEAAQEGYYVAPEGAQLEEEANVEEMAAFSGKTENKGEQTRTTTFSGLMPGELYFFAVSKSTGSPDSIADVVSAENLVYADAKYALSDGTLSFENYQLTTGEAVIVQLYGYPNVKSIRFKGLDEAGEVDENGNTIQNLTLNMDETFDLGVLVEPAQWANEVTWAVSADGIVDVDTDSTKATNTVEARNAGTVYVTATVNHGPYALTATCRVRVVNQVAEKLSDVELKDTSVTTELYRTEGTLINIFPQFSDRPAQASVQAGFNADEGDDAAAAGHLIQSAFFGTVEENNKNYQKEQANADLMNQLFDLEVVDDWTLRLIPTQYAVENPKEVSSKYTSKITVVVDGEEIVTSQALAVSVKKTTPKLTADNIQINSFYDTKSYEINVKGATVTGISEAENKTFPEWLSLSDNELTPSDMAADQRSRSATVYLSVYTEEWAIPAEVKVGVTMRYTAPAVRLSIKAVTLSSANSNGITIQLLSQDKTRTLENMFIEDVTSDGQLSVESFDLKTGKLVLGETDTLVNGTDNIEILFQDASNTLKLPLQIRTATPKLQLSKTSVSMNTQVGDKAAIKLNMTPSDAKLPEGLECYVTDSRNRPQEDLEITQLDAEVEGEYLIVRTENQAYASAYRVHITDGNKDLAVLNVKPLARGTSASVNLKASGTLDLTYPTKGASLTRTYRNMVSPEEETFTLKLNGKTVDFADYLTEGSDGKFYIADGAELKSGDKLAIRVNGIVDGDVACTSNEVTFTVKRTPVNIRLSKSSVTLNKDMEEQVAITYTYTPSDKDAKKDDEPTLEITDSRGNDATDFVTVENVNGAIKVSLEDGAEYGKVYKVSLKATKDDKAAVLTVKVATATNSKVTYTTTVSGSIDPTRDASKVTVKYSVRNFADTKPVLKIVDTIADEDVTGLFDIEQNSKNLSQFFVTKKPASVLDTNHKYQVVADYAGRDDLSDDSFITAKPAVLKVAAAKSTVKADRTVTIYKKDQKASYKFTVTSTDKKLNNVEKLTVKDSKLQNVYKIISLGEGNFELYVQADNMESVKAGNLTLNYFVRGMEVQLDKKGNEIPNGTFNLKIAVK